MYLKAKKARACTREGQRRKEKNKGGKKRTNDRTNKPMNAIRRLNY